MLLSNLKRIISFILFIIPTFTLAQQNNYVPLADIGNYIPQNTPINGIAGYLQTMFRLGIGVATGLAVIMIIIGGVQYMSTDAAEDKWDGKDKVTSALWGLLIALASYILLNTINPALVSNNLAVDTANSTTQSSGGNAISGFGGNSSIGQPVQPYQNPTDYQTTGIGSNPFNTAGNTGPNGLSFSDPSLNTGLNGSPLQNSYKDPNTGNVILTYADGSQIIQYWGPSGATGGGEYYDSKGYREVNGKVVTYTDYQNGNPVYHFADGTSYTGTCSSYGC